MNRFIQIIWWVITNAPEIWALIKQILDLLEEAGNANRSVASMEVEATVKGKRPAKIRGTIRADLN